MHDILVGARSELKVTVTPEMAISFLGEDGPRVLSTPQMILYMERACRTMLVAMLEPGHDSLGTKVCVSHLAAAPIGAEAVFSAEITSVDEKRVEFRIEAWSGDRKLGEGTHQRTIINVARFSEKMTKSG
jgi:fluoroacetyl-CoA thioesterase